jgi:hypothetical protein
MISALTPNQSAIQTAIRAFLISLFPSGVEVFQAQDNRVPEPQGANFIIMTVLFRTRLATNIHTYADVQFTAAISGLNLVVSAVKFGTIQIGSQVFGVNVSGSPTIQSQASGTTGGVGTYLISGPSQTVASETMAAGIDIITQPTRVTVQLDVHSGSILTASDMAQTISTLFRDTYATSFFSENYPGIAPLYADDPRQVPFVNAEQQYESRYVVTAELQANQSVSLPQQFADQLEVTLTPVEALQP